jgi:hypothetical protein
MGAIAALPACGHKPPPTPLDRGGAQTPAVTSRSPLAKIPRDATRAVRVDVSRLRGTSLLASTLDALQNGEMGMHLREAKGRCGVPPAEAMTELVLSRGIDLHVAVAGVTLTDPAALVCTQTIAGREGSFEGLAATHFDNGDVGVVKDGFVFVGNVLGVKEALAAHLGDNHLSERLELPQGSVAVAYGDSPTESLRKVAATLEADEAHVAFDGAFELESDAAASDVARTLEPVVATAQSSGAESSVTAKGVTLHVHFSKKGTLQDQTATLAGVSSGFAAALTQVFVAAPPAPPATRPPPAGPCPVPAAALRKLPPIAWKARRGHKTTAFSCDAYVAAYLQLVQGSIDPTYDERCDPRIKALTCDAGMSDDQWDCITKATTVNVWKRCLH